jgi:hypothetical protein
MLEIYLESHIFDAFQMRSNSWGAYKALCPVPYICVLGLQSETGLGSGIQKIDLME